MVSPGQRIGVAVSGGADSVCLLHVLNELAAAMSIHLTVVHLNHCLRGEESDRDEAAVAQLAAGLGIGFVAQRVDVAALGGNLEEAGREARRALFAEVISSGTLDLVATGHTRDDQAETVLYRFLRGSGTAGLAGIHPVNGRVIRPLIHSRRSDIENYLRQNGLAWREDMSNLDLRFARNRLRHQLLPAIQADHNPSISDVLAATASVARDEEEFWKSHLELISPELLVRHGRAIMARAADLAKLHVAVRRRIVRQATVLAKGNLRGIGVLHIEQMLKLVSQEEGHGRVQAGGVDVFRSFDWLRFSPVRVGSREQFDYRYEVNPPCDVRLPFSGESAGNVPTSVGGTVRMEVIHLTATNRDERVYNESSLLDFDRLERPLELRNWQPGDRYESAHGGQKIKQLFQRERIPLWDRQGWPILTSHGKIAWARKFGVADAFAPGTGCERVLWIREETLADSAEPNMLP